MATRLGETREDFGGEDTVGLQVRRKGKNYDEEAILNGTSDSDIEKDFGIFAGRDIEGDFVIFILDLGITSSGEHEKFSTLDEMKAVWELD